MENRLPQNNSDKSTFTSGWPPTYQPNYPYTNTDPNNQNNLDFFNPFASNEKINQNTFNYSQSQPYNPSTNLPYGNIISNNQYENKDSFFTYDTYSDCNESEYIVTTEKLTDLDISSQTESDLLTKFDNPFYSNNIQVLQPTNVQSKQNTSTNVNPLEHKITTKEDTIFHQSTSKTEEFISFDQPNKSNSHSYNSLYHFRIPWRDPNAIIGSNNKPLEILSTPNEFIINFIGRTHNKSLVIKKVNNQAGSINELASDTLSKQYSKRYTSYGLLGIISLELPNKTFETFLVFIIGIEHVGNITDIPIYKITQVHFVSFNYSEEMSYNPTKKYPYDEFKSFCENGSFYFSLDYDLTHSQQRLHEMRNEIMNKGACHAADSRFFWNRHLAKPFINRELDDYVAIVIRGHISILNIKNSGTEKNYDFILVSRISCSRAGTRYNARGINDNGDVANFVETEQIVSNKKYLTSFLQIRGSVPIYWEEPLTKTGYIPTLSRASNANSHVFKKHFDDLYNKYGKVHIVNLLGYKKKEGIICHAYEDQLANLKILTNSRLSYTHFDFHTECSSQNFENLKKLNTTIKDDMSFFGFFKYDLKNFKILQIQKGIFRTNCLDCLDRTNVTQTSIAQEALMNQIRSVFSTSSIQTYSLLSVFNTFWADNGDNLSLSYAGTGAINSSYTRKGKSSLAGLFNNSFKSISRFYINTFKDTDTQKYVDLYLGKIDYRIDNEEDVWVKTELNKREHEYTSYFPKNVFIGTFNCLGKPPPSIHPVEKIVQPNLKFEDIDLWVFGFQEVVELNPSQIFNANTANGKLWDEYLLKYLNSKRSEVVHLKSEQLVGIYISLFVSKKELPHIKNVNYCCSKVGLKGMSGDKGAITISFDYYDTSICFISSHLSSGQKNYNDRINDYKSISNNIRIGTYPKTSKKINDHDYAFWLGDMNWRIDLPYEKTMHYILNGDINSLLKYDQLKTAKENKHAFHDFQEGLITFFPTYKFSVGSNKYEPIEINRPPGWTDRILFKSLNNQPIECINYSSVDLYISDHLPVIGEFSFVIKNINHEKRQKMEEELYKRNQTLNSLL